MPAMRFPLPKLFLAVSFAAVACAGLFSPTYWWTASIVSITIALFAITAIRAIVLRGREQVIAIAFALVGIAYLLIVTSGPSRFLAKMLVTNYPIAWFVVALDRADVATGPTYALVPIYRPSIGANGSVTIGSVAPPRLAPPAAGMSYSAPGPSSAAVPIPPPPTPSPSERLAPSEIIIAEGMSGDDERQPLSRTFLIGHCVWSWLIALLAGWLAGRVYAKRQVGRPSPTR
jgi:hypothetical protein